mgnify:CR=1 FL=1
MADYIERANQILKVTYPFLTNDDLEALLKISQFRVCYNKEVLIRSGQINQNSFFILKGMIRGFFINEKGDEKNIFLRPEHTISGAPECLFHNKPTKFTFESILETELLVFNFEELKSLEKEYGVNFNEKNDSMFKINNQNGLNYQYVNLNRQNQTIKHIKKVRFFVENESENRPFIFTIKFNLNRSKVIVKKTASAINTLVR